jgi:hypothetical protein
VNKAAKLDELVGSVEELLARLPENLDPAISALRDRVDDGIFDAWTAITRERAAARYPALSAGPLKLGVLLGLIACACTAGMLIAGKPSVKARLSGRFLR